MNSKTFSAPHGNHSGIVERFIQVLRRKHRISHQLLISIVFVSSIITVVSTGIQLLNDYRQGVKNLQSDINLIESVYLKPLAESVWLFSDQLVNTQLQALSSLEGIKHLEIEINGEPRWDFGDALESPSLTKEFPIQHFALGEVQSIGTLKIYATYENIYQGLINKAGVILVSNAIKTFLVASFILFIVNYLITQHLEGFSKFVKQDNFLNSAEIYRFNRQETEHIPPDELDNLLNSYNQMRHKLHESVSALRNSEQQIRCLTDTTVEAILGFDENGRCTFCNHTGLKMLGLENIEQAVGQNAASLIELEPIDPDDAKSCRQHTLQLKKPLHLLKKSLVRQDGSSFPIELWSRPIVLKQEYAGCVVTIFDITKRLKDENDLANAKKRAEEASNAKSEFLAHMSHELRTPLNAILGFNQMLKFSPNDKLTETQSKYVDCIDKGSVHLLELVNNLLDLTKIEDNTLEFHLERVDAEEVVKDSLAMIQTIAEATNISFVEQYRETNNMILYTDEFRLRQVLLNLLSNAVKFNKPGGTVSIESHSVGGRFLRLAINDTGMGIADCDKEKIFNRFFRTSENSRIAAGGSGIGLSVCKPIINQLGGQIGFESQVGKGSTFWLELPFYKEERASRSVLP